MPVRVSPHAKRSCRALTAAARLLLHANAALAAVLLLHVLSGFQPVPEPDTAALLSLGLLALAQLGRRRASGLLPGS